MDPLPFDADPAGPPVEIRRSARRKRTVSARMEQGRIIVMVPARLSQREEAKLVKEMVAKVQSQQRRTQRGVSDEVLLTRASQLSRRYLEGRAQPTVVRWVTNQRNRWGSCTPTTGHIRLSARLQTMPRYVIDYVLLHELVHLLVPDHGPRFHALMEAYPDLVRARAFLDGVSHVDQVGIGDGMSQASDEITED
ncbi:M48 family metallopeptidase [Demetria terragena]|uniref:M48 metallopeptidase family protein n=1 Tax=Demetria terragena TaxID=63959 RepID=UPI000683EAD6|nr:M48 family metallopeptidase [Demetria terragena]